MSSNIPFSAYPANMNTYINRLRTFGKWKYCYISKQKLSNSGFYYTNIDDETACAFCKVQISRWESGDIPDIEHKKWAGQCPFIQYKMVNDILDCDENNDIDHSIKLSHPTHREYVEKSSRLKSFEEWPKYIKQRPEELAEAGFYYVGIGDRTRCFYCSIEIKDWAPEDTAWEEHARWLDKCAYLRLMKSDDFIKRNKNNAIINISKKNGNTKLTYKKESNQCDDRILCKICYSNEINCLMCCGHVCCSECLFNITICPICRKSIINTNIRKIYL
jgi:baculoviral IAP repeat-containing protein 7/8